MTHSSSKDTGAQPYERWREQGGFSLIELLVAMLIGLVVSLAAFSILQFTTDDVSRITSRAHVSQTARVALEKIMLQLHSACVAASVAPVQTGSTKEKIRFISETSPVNSVGEPISSLSTVRLHEILYTPASGITPGTLTENSWPSSGTSPNFTFNTEHEIPTKRNLLTGVEPTGSIPMFRYYRYYHTGDTGAVLGELDPNEIILKGTLENEKTEAKEIAKVAVSFTLAPEGHESIIAKGGQPVALEDSAIFRLATSSEASGTVNPNLPCSPET